MLYNGSFIAGGNILRVRRKKKLERKDIAIKSPNDGVAPYHLSKFIGKTLKVDLKEDENLNFKFQIANLKLKFQFSGQIARSARASHAIGTEDSKL